MLHIQSFVTLLTPHFQPCPISTYNLTLSCNVHLSNSWSQRINNQVFRCYMKMTQIGPIGGIILLPLRIINSLSLSLSHIFDHAFHISSTKPNPCTNFSHNDNVHSQFATLIGKVHVKCNIVGLIGHIWPLKTIIESIYLSQFTSYYGVPLCFL